MPETDGRHAPRAATGGWQRPGAQGASWVVVSDLAETVFCDRSCGRLGFRSPRVNQADNPLHGRGAGYRSHACRHSRRHAQRSVLWMRTTSRRARSEEPSANISGARGSALGSSLRSHRGQPREPAHPPSAWSGRCRSTIGSAATAARSGRPSIRRLIVPTVALCWMNSAAPRPEAGVQAAHRQLHPAWRSPHRHAECAFYGLQVGFANPRPVPRVKA